MHHNESAEPPALLAPHDEPAKPARGLEGRDLVLSIVHLDEGRVREEF